MFQRILVPLDGSARAEQAIPTAARIAQVFGGTIIMLCVVPPTSRPEKGGMPEAYPIVGTDEQLAEATEYLKSVATSRPLVGIPTEVHTAIGETAPTLLDAVQSLHADFLIVCRHGLSGFAHWGLGGVAYKLVQRCPVPLLLLPDGGRELAPAEQHQIRALVTLDGSPFSEAVLEPVAHLLAGLTQARGQHGALLLLQVVGIPTSYGRFRSKVISPDNARQQAEAEKRAEYYLETVARRLTDGELAKYHLAVTTRVATDPDVAKAIVYTAEHTLVDVIAMTTHGWSGVLRWALGSIMERVLHTTRAPLFILRPPNE
ncbi:MAG TPA: universal stress protein [Ktedonobacteraceae bacterium]|nr:universal stress protein [Ktedonobacteraceae bacterium]